MSHSPDPRDFSATQSVPAVAIVSLAEVRKGNEKFRIDDGYFNLLAIDTQKRIDAIPHRTLGSIASTFRKGIFDIKADTYESSGVPFVRVGNLKKGLIAKTGLAFISETAHASESETGLSFGDLILSKTAYPAASFVNLPRCNVSQDTIAIRLSPEGRRLFHPAFIAVFLNTSRGLALMQRYFQGNIQLHLSLTDGRKIPIPTLPMSFQDDIANRLLEADANLEKAEAFAQDAASAADLACGISGFVEPHPLSYEVLASEAFGRRRLDAEHFQPRFASLIHQVQRNGISIERLGAIVEPLISGLDLRNFVDDGTPYVRVGDIRAGRIALETAKRVVVDPANIKKDISLAAGDVLFTRKGSFGNAAHVLPGQEHAIISTEIIRLRLTREASRRILPEYLAAYFNGKVGRSQAQQWAHGVAFFSVSQKDLSQFEVPIPSLERQHRVKELLADAQAARDESERLFDDAIQRVDRAVSSVALNYLEAGEIIA